MFILVDLKKKYTKTSKGKLHLFHGKQQCSVAFQNYKTRVLLSFHEYKSKVLHENIIKRSESRKICAHAHTSFTNNLRCICISRLSAINIPFQYTWRLSYICGDESLSLRKMENRTS